MGTYCARHLEKIRNGGGIVPCTVCGVGVHNILALCKNCGYNKQKVKAWHRRRKEAIMKEIITNEEFARLANIDFSN
jgi:hypothetical protein